MYLCKVKMFKDWNVKSWRNKYCYFLCINYYCNPENTKKCQSRYTPLKIDTMEDLHWNMSEETKLLLPVLSAPLQTGKIRIWPTRTKHTGLQLVPDRCDLPNSAKRSTLSLLITAWHLELTKIFYNRMLLLIVLK
jgi:hypothetical protein